MIIEWPPLAGVEAVLDEAASAVAAAAATRHSCAKKEKEEAIRGGFWPRLALASTLSDPAAGRAAQEPRHVPSRAPSDAPPPGPVRHTRSSGKTPNEQQSALPAAARRRDSAGHAREALESTRRAPRRAQFPEKPRGANRYETVGQSTRAAGTNCTRHGHLQQGPKKYGQRRSQINK